MAEVSSVCIADLISELARRNYTTAPEFNSHAAKAIWDLEGSAKFLVFVIQTHHLLIGIYATSRHIPGVRFAGVTHPGIMYLLSSLLPSPTLTSPLQWDSTKRRTSRDVEHARKRADHRLQKSNHACCLSSRSQRSSYRNKGTSRRWCSAEDR
jgi:hypothetical protein